MQLGVIGLGRMGANIVWRVMRQGPRRAAAGDPRPAGSSHSVWPGMSLRQILQFYTDHGPRIFRDRSRLRGMKHLLRGKYSAAPLRAAVDVAMATAAAPTYLPGMSLDGARLIDGGIWGNNPVMVALTEAVGPLGVQLDAIRVFSVGTTTDLPRRSRRLDRGGLLPWARGAHRGALRTRPEEHLVETQ